MSLYKDIIEKKEKIALVGLGYVGMPIAVAFAKKAEVIGFDLNNEKWTPIVWFYGTFNGNGHKITNFYMDLADVFMINDNENLWGLSFFAAAEKISNFSIETIKGRQWSIRCCYGW